MKNGYLVTIRAVITKTIDVIAEDEEEAEELASDMFDAGDLHNSSYEQDVTHIERSYIERED